MDLLEKISSVPECGQLVEDVNEKLVSEARRINAKYDIVACGDDKIVVDGEVVLQGTAEKEKVYIIQANWAVAADDGAGGGGYIIDQSDADTLDNTVDDSICINNEMMAAVVDPHNNNDEMIVDKSDAVDMSDAVENFDLTFF